MILIQLKNMDNDHFQNNIYRDRFGQAPEVLFSLSLIEIEPFSKEIPVQTAKATTRIKTITIGITKYKLVPFMILIIY